MTYFQLRKREPEADPEAVEEEVNDTEEEPYDELATAAQGQPAGWGGAIWCGITGPWHWLVAHLGPYGVGTAWSVYVGSVWAFFYYGDAVAAGLTFAWLIAVLLFVPREFKDRATAAIERLHTPRSGRSPDADETPVHAIVAPLWRLIGDAPGAHLKTLTEHLQAAAPEHPLDKAAVRAKLAALGIPVKPSVRDAAGRVNEGVHRADLKAWEEALSPATPGTPSEAPRGPVATALTRYVAGAATAVATPLSAFRRLLSRGAE